MGFAEHREVSDRRRRRRHWWLSYSFLGIPQQWRSCCGSIRLPNQARAPLFGRDANMTGMTDALKVRLVVLASEVMAIAIDRSDVVHLSPRGWGFNCPTETTREPRYRHPPERPAATHAIVIPPEARAARRLPEMIALKPLTTLSRAIRSIARDGATALPTPRRRGTRRSIAIRHLTHALSPPTPRANPTNHTAAYGGTTVATIPQY